MNQQQILDRMAQAVVEGHEVATKIGADGYGKTAIQAVATARRLVGKA